MFRLLTKYAPSQSSFWGCIRILQTPVDPISSGKTGKQHFYLYDKIIGEKKPVGVSMVD